MTIGVATLRDLLTTPCIQAGTRLQVRRDDCVLHGRYREPSLSAIDIK